MLEERSEMQDLRSASLEARLRRGKRSASLEARLRRGKRSASLEAKAEERKEDRFA